MAKVINKINEINVNELQIKDTIIIPGKKGDNDSVKLMVMTDCSDLFFVFKCFETIADISNIKNTCFRTRDFNELYINIGNVLHILPSKKYYPEPFTENDLNTKDNKKLIAVCNKITDTTKVFDDIINIRNVTLSFLSIPIKDNNHIVFISEHKILPEKFQWKVNNSAFLFTADKKAIRINCDFDILLKLMQKGKYFNLDNHSLFEDSLFAQNYDIEDSIYDDKAGLKKIINLFKENTYVNEKQIEHFFDPFYENEELGLKCYCGYFREKSESREIITYLCGQKISLSILGPHCDFSIRVINALFDFLNNSCTGIDPISGKFLLDGSERDNTAKYIIYQDCEGIIYDNYSHTSYKSSIREIYFIKINGYFLLTNPNDEEEKKLEKDLKERQRVINKMTT